MASKKGFAQIPILIGMVFLTLVIPLTLDLVEEKQDIRKMAKVCNEEGEECLYYRPENEAKPTPTVIINPGRDDRTTNNMPEPTSAVSVNQDTSVRTSGASGGETSIPTPTAQASPLPEDIDKWRCPGPSCDKCGYLGWWGDGCREFVQKKPSDAPYADAKNLAPSQAGPRTSCGAFHRRCSPGAGAPPCGEATNFEILSGCGTDGCYAITGHCQQSPTPTHAIPSPTISQSPSPTATITDTPTPVPIRPSASQCAGKSDGPQFIGNECYYCSGGIGGQIDKSSCTRYITSCDECRRNATNPTAECADTCGYTALSITNTPPTPTARILTDCESCMNAGGSMWTDCAEICGYPKPTLTITQTPTTVQSVTQTITQTPTRTNTAVNSSISPTFSPSPAPSATTTKTPTPAETVVNALEDMADGLASEAKRWWMINATSILTGGKDITIVDAEGDYAQVPRPGGLSDGQLKNIYDYYKNFSIIKEGTIDNYAFTIKSGVDISNALEASNKFYSEVYDKVPIEFWQEIATKMNEKAKERIKLQESNTPTPTPTQSPTPLATLVATATRTATQIATAFATAFGLTTTPTPTSTPSRTPTVTATRTSTGFASPTPRNIPTVAVVNNAPKDDFDASKLPNTNPFGTVVGNNLDSRKVAENSTRLNYGTGNAEHTTGKSIFYVDGTGESDAPQLTCLLRNANGTCIKNPPITELYNLNDWAWTDSQKTAVKDNGPIAPNPGDNSGRQNWGVQAIALSASNAQTINVPGVRDSSQNNDIKVAVLYADDNNISLRYFNKGVDITDSVAKDPKHQNADHAFTLHLTNIAVTKDIVDKVKAIGYGTDRKNLVMLSVNDIIGLPLVGKDPVVAVRAAGSLMDTRVKKDWWNEADMPANNGLITINRTSSITPAAGQNVLSRYEIGSPVQRGDENTIKNAITINTSTITEVTNPNRNVSEKDDPRHPNMATIFPVNTQLVVNSYKGCPANQTCNAEVTMLGLKPSTDTAIKAPVAANGKNYDIGGGFGTMVTYKCPDNKCIALNYSPDALKIPDKGYTIVFFGDINLDSELIKAYNDGIKSGKFPTLKPGQEIGASKGEVKILIINDGKVVNPYPFFKQ